MTELAATAKADYCHRCERRVALNYREWLLIGPGKDVCGAALGLVYTQRDCDEIYVARLEREKSELVVLVLALGKCAVCRGSGRDGPDLDGFTVQCSYCSGTGHIKGVRQYLPKATC